MLLLLELTSIENSSVILSSCRLPTFSCSASSSSFLRNCPSSISVSGNWGLQVNSRPISGIALLQNLSQENWGLQVYLKTSFWSSSRRVWFWSLQSSSWEISFLPATSLSCISRWDENHEYKTICKFGGSWITWTSLIFFDFSITRVALESSWSRTCNGGT